MALQFTSGNGYVAIPRVTFNNDLSITGFVEWTNSGGTNVILGDTVDTQSFIGNATSNRMQFKLGGTTVDVVSSFVVGTVYEFTVTKVGTTLTCTVNGVTETTTQNLPITFNAFGQATGSFFYEGKIEGIWTMTGDASGTRTYDFNQNVGVTTLPDTTSGQDGTLTGDFTGGGFDGLGDIIEITSIDDYECRQRDNNNQAVFTVAGTTTSQATSVEYQLDSGSWAVLDPSPSTTTFSGSVTVTGQQTVSVRYSNQPAVIDSKVYVSAAACVPAIWQSNEQGEGINYQSYPVTGIQPLMWKSSTFQPMTDPVNYIGGVGGSMWPRLGQLYADAGIVLCVRNIAVGGSKIAAWQRGGGNYANITTFHNVVGGFEFTTSVGGENDSEDGTTELSMYTLLTQLCVDLNNDFGTTHYLTYFPVGDGLAATPTNIANMRSAFDDVIADNSFVRFGGDLSVIDIDVATNAGNDGLHLKQDADLETGADLRFSAQRSTELTINTVGVPDGNYDAVLWDSSRNIVFNDVLSITSNSLSVLVLAEIGETIRGDAYDPLGADTDGMRLKGVTV